ncbi:UNVERIFIED_CONTAM: hypothetical protein Sradi_1095300, partial [Sesamum radiatum]
SSEYWLASATSFDFGAHLMKHLNNAISSVGYSKFSKHINNFKKAIISSFYGSKRSYIWSNIKEEEALERYKLITRNTVSYPEFQVYGKKNPEDNWLAASPDGAVNSFIYGLPTHGVLEIKCPFFGGDMSKAQPWKRVPLHYIPQAQGLMEILDRDWMDMYVWTVNGSSLFRLQRDVEYWNILKTALSDF